MGSKVSNAPQEPPRIVLVGGGFGGLTCAQALRKANAKITLVDRTNHHLFQPLLYQVATAALSPAQIAAPIRQILSRQKNAEVILAEAVAADPDRRVLRLADEEIAYDVLVLAAGATTSYFGHDDWKPVAPGLKTIEDALEIRERFLEAFERAERIRDPEARIPDLTFVIVGGGPTGVETAGAIREIALHQVPRDFRKVDTTRSRIVLVEAQDRLLPAGFDETLCRRAERDLRDMGVEVRLGTRVASIDEGGVDLDGPVGRERIATHNVIWAAGIRPSPLAASLGCPLDRAGRVLVEPDLSVPGRPEIFVLGDLASVVDRSNGKPVPGIAPAAMQMGRHVARVLRTGKREPFRYRDKGMLATIGRARAVGALGRFRVTGLVAWLLWSGVHVFYLISFRQRVLVMLDWIWSYLFFSGGARLITNPERGRRQPPDPGGGTPGSPSGAS
jgi:NADH dehydrogenase